MYTDNMVSKLKEMIVSQDGYSLVLGQVEAVAWHNVKGEFSPHACKVVGIFSSQRINPQEATRLSRNHNLYHAVFREGFSGAST